MGQFNLDFVLQATKGQSLSRHQELFSGIGTDTRKNLQDQLFIALKGDSFDAHQFLNKAAEQGAAALLVHHVTPEVQELAKHTTIIKVADTLLALQDLANAYRKKINSIIIGIAGSNGKTTSKEFTAQLLGEFRKTHFAKGSFNNHWGVPFTLLAQPEDTEVAVVEMGMNHKGELAQLAKIAEANIVVCTYVGVEHIEHFGSLEKIAEAESEIYDYSPALATRIFNLDNPYTLKMFEQCKAKYSNSKTITFSSERSADVSFRLKNVSMSQLTVAGTIAGCHGEATVEVFGKHNMTNLMVAASAALAAGLQPDQIWSGLSVCHSNWGRNQLLQTESGAQILFDGYNSNPDSMLALIENLQLIPSTVGKRIGVFAEMKELGEQASVLHQKVAMQVGQAQFDLIWFYGKYKENFAQGLQQANFRGELLTSADYDFQIAEKIIASLSSNDFVIVKGSRGMHIERFVKQGRALNFLEK